MAGDLNDGCHQVRNEKKKSQNSHSGFQYILKIYNSLFNQGSSRNKTVSRLRMRKGRSVVHTNLEDNYSAVIVANHEALSQVLDQVNAHAAKKSNYAQIYLIRKSFSLSYNSHKMCHQLCGRSLIVSIFASMISLFSIPLVWLLASAFFIKHSGKIQFMPHLF